MDYSTHCRLDLYSCLCSTNCFSLLQTSSTLEFLNSQTRQWKKWYDSFLQQLKVNCLGCKYLIKLLYCLESFCYKENREFLQMNTTNRKQLLLEGNLREATSISIIYANYHYACALLLIQINDERINVCCTNQVL